MSRIHRRWSALVLACVTSHGCATAPVSHGSHSAPPGPISASNQGASAERRGPVKGDPHDHASDVSIRLDQLFGAVAPELFSGVVLIVRGEDTLIHRGYGHAQRSARVPVTTGTAFPIASLSKQFTAAAILKLVANGRVAVNDTLGDLLPEVPADKRGISLHHLLTGTSGLPRDVAPSDAVIERDSLVRAILRAPLGGVPGSAHAYSNAGYLLLAAIVERRAGVPFERYLQDQLFTPAGLTSTGFVGPAWRTPVAHGYGGDDPESVLDDPAARKGWHRRGAGGLLSTASDLFRWERALTSGRVLPDSLVQTLFTPYVAEQKGGTSYYGYGWRVNRTAAGATTISHNGGWAPSYYAELRRYPTSGVVAILLTNQRGAAATDIWNTALRLVALGDSSAGP